MPESTLESAPPGLRVLADVAEILAAGLVTEDALVRVVAVLRVGQARGTQFALLAGPAWFAGDVTHAHAFLGARVEIPLARRGGGP